MYNRNNIGELIKVADIFLPVYINTHNVLPTNINPTANLVQ